MPPPKLSTASLPDSVLSTTLADPLSTKTPPPWRALLPDIVLRSSRTGP